MKTGVAVVIVLLAVAVTGYVVYNYKMCPLSNPGTPGSRTLLKVGSPAPDFTWKTLDGREVTRKSLTDAGGGYLVFFSTTCMACIEEIPHTNQLVAEIEVSGTALPIYGVDVEEPPAAVEQFVKKKDIRYPVLLGPLKEVTGSFSVSGVPTVLGIDGKGVVRYRDEQLPETLEAARKALQ